jgi:hypothetical protein
MFSDFHLPFVPVEVTYNEEPLTLYIATYDFPRGIGGDRVDLNPNARVYLTTEPNMNDPESYWKPDLLGGFVEYDTNFSSVECGCVADIYLVSMPAKNEDGSYYPCYDNLYYCDANQIGGSFCPEFDLIEANLRAF